MVLCGQVGPHQTEGGIMAKRSEWGAVRQLPSGRYQAKYRDDAGRWTTAPNTFEAKADAQVWLAAKRTDLRRGLDIDDRAARQPLSHWWPLVAADAQRRLKPSTIKYYGEVWDDHVEPRFGATAVGRIRPGHVDAWIGDLIDAGISASRIKGAVGVLSRTLDRAVRDRAIPANPASSRDVRIPSAPQIERPVLTPAEIVALHDAAYVPATADDPAKGSPALAVMVSVLAWGGLRIGELLAMQRQDVDLTAGTVTVQRSLSEIEGVIHVTATKTGKDRVVTLPAGVVTELRQHLKGVAIHKQAWLFPSANGKPQRYTNFRLRQWLPMVTRMNTARTKAKQPPLDVMPHDLRATCASLLIDAGASPKDVQHHLGHADITTTLNLYARVRPGRADDLASRMDAMLAEAATAT